MNRILILIPFLFLSVKPHEKIKEIAEVQSNLERDTIFIGFVTENLIESKNELDSLTFRRDLLKKELIQLNK